jgi:hypothetical protein
MAQAGITYSVDPFDKSDFFECARCGKFFNMRAKRTSIARGDWRRAKVDVRGAVFRNGEVS